MTSPAETSPPSLEGLTIGLLGGTGEQGRGLARRFGLAGLPVLLGSRTASRAEEAAEGLAGVKGCLNEQVAEAADIVIVAVPWEGHEALLRGLAGLLEGRLVVDCVNPLAFGKGGPWPVPPPEGSAAQQAAALLPGSRVCAAFHHISARLLLDGDGPLDTDVLVAGDVRADKDLVIALAATIDGMRGIDAGPLHLAGALEAMTAVLIAVNRRYKAHAGLRVTDV
ncbi:MAG: 8-hydroxy-5-deazaflavin:NADPH oxidoreductase [Frankiales bacterium]|jgi:NADPH-dependent F420 reductase|nr:8-hydroxy-5-deazaflavin:NADPH oxidoreductase [Frankiales bacterium]